MIIMDHDVCCLKSTTPDRFAKYREKMYRPIKDPPRYCVHLEIEHLLNCKGLAEGMPQVVCHGAAAT